MNTLYYGDNLEILRKYIRDESVDLIYLDPPFNSQRAYNVIFQDKSGKSPTAQIQAFEDTWYWTEETQAAFDEIMTGKYRSELKEMMNAFRQFMGTTNLMAYLTMMAIRLVEMHRVLKMTGSLYLHCDPTASHYLKILLDQVFGLENFRNEIVWKRTTSSSSKAIAVRFGSDHDLVFFYSKSRRHQFNQQYVPFDEEYVKRRFTGVDERGRYKDAQLKTYSEGTMEQLKKEDRLIVTRGGKYRYKMYLDEVKGVPLDDVWTDVFPVNAVAKERLGYPTQKPVALLERIIQASSNDGDVVLDPFCGCGTAIAAAEKLGRKWLGIDITHLAISLIKKRIKDHFPDAKFEVVGEPKSVEDAEELFKQSAFQFESWAVSLVGGQPYKSTGGGDTGMDGFLYFKDFEGKFHRIVIEVKGGAYQPKDIRALARVLEREEAPLGLLIALKSPTKGMLTEAAALGKWTMPVSGKKYRRLQVVTIQELFDGKKPELPDTSETLKKAKRVLREQDKNHNLF